MRFRALAELTKAFVSSLDQNLNSLPVVLIRVEYRCDKKILSEKYSAKILNLGALMEHIYKLHPIFLC